MKSYAHVVHRLGFLALILGALIVGPALTRAIAPAQAAPTAGGGTPATASWLRLGHLAPGAAPVDVWLTPFGGTAGSAAVKGVAYGTVSAYRTMTPGFYTVAMRPAGSSVTVPAMLTDTVQVAAGSAYTVLAEGVADPLGLVVTKDDLAPPAGGHGRVRVIQASTVGPVVDVRAVMGPALATSAPYGLIGKYTEVPQGRWTLALSAGSLSSSVTVDVRSSSVNTLLVLNSGSGVTVKAIVDAVGSTAMPKGGVETGGGGIAGGGIVADRSLFNSLLAAAARP